MYAFCLSCPSATFAHQYGGFVPREWLPAKGLLKRVGTIKMLEQLSLQRNEEEIKPASKLLNTHSYVCKITTS